MKKKITKEDFINETNLWLSEPRYGFLPDNQPEYVSLVEAQRIAILQLFRVWIDDLKDVAEFIEEFELSL